MTPVRKPRKKIKWKPSPAALVRSFESAISSLRGVEIRKMFGYPAIFINGNMFAGLVRDSMILRLGEKDKERFLELPEARPFVAMKGRVMKQWAVVPSAMIKSKSELKVWLGKALAHGRSLPAKVAKRNRSGKERFSVNKETTRS
jgi:TfoX/Sxy family transcriptional regulator of competence genes